MNHAFTIHWARVRRALLNELTKSLEKCSDPQHALASFQKEPLDNVCEALKNQQYLQSSGAVWELIETATPELINTTEQKIRHDSDADEPLDAGVFYKQLEAVLNDAQERFLRDAGCSQLYVRNLKNWYRIYPVIKELNKELEGRNLSPTDETYIRALKNKILQKGIKCARRETRLLDIIFDFYYERTSSLDFEVPVLEPEISELMGYHEKIMRMNVCFVKLKEYNLEMHSVIKMSVIDNKSDKHIYDALAMSNTKFRSRKTKGLQLLEKCLEEHSLDVLSNLEGAAQ